MVIYPKTLYSPLRRSEYLEYFQRGLNLRHGSYLASDGVLLTGGAFYLKGSRGGRGENPDEPGPDR
jgi:hypothetical protein